MKVSRRVGVVVLFFLWLYNAVLIYFFFFSSRRRHTRYIGDWSSDVCSTDLGQFEGYRAEAGVAPDSTVETFVALRLCVNSPRWAGVPFYIRAGKRLPVSATEIRVELDRPGNFVRFRLSPEVAISLGARTKAPGEAMVGEDVELLVKNFEAGEMTPYERLIGDAIRGDAMLFVREDEVETAWTVVEPVLGDATPVHEYAQETWGPSAADTVAPPGGWHPPSP